MLPFKMTWLPYKDQSDEEVRCYPEYKETPKKTLDEEISELCAEVEEEGAK